MAFPFFRRESFNEDSASGCSLVSRGRGAVADLISLCRFPMEG
jgi:hypothetical protein